MANTSDSYALGYDAAGHVTSRRVSYGVGNERVYRTAYDLRGHKALDFYYDKVGVSTGSIQTRYRYDLNGALVESTSYYAQGTWVDMGMGPGNEPRGKLDISGWLMNASSYTYNLDGNQTQQIERLRDPYTNWYQLSPEKNPGVNVAQKQSTDITVLLRDSQVDSQYDSLGRMAGYTYTARDLQYATHTYTSEYVGWEGYQEKSVTGDSSNSNYRATTNTLTYDGFGRLVKQNEHTPLPDDYGTLEDRTRVYSYQGEGRVQTRREGATDENGVFTQEADAYGRKGNYLFVQAAGQELAQLAEAGTITTSNGAIYLTPVMSGLQDGDYSAVGGKVTVLAGETLQALAQRLYGNAGLWYVLADANGLSDPDAPLAAGTQLSAPDVRVTANDAGTFKPYDPSKAIGPTSPGLPYITPPPKQHCNAVAMILIVVVAVVVSIVTYGAATGWFAALGSTGSAIAAGAVAGAAASAASGVVSSALGVGSFSWRSVAAGAITGALTAGLGDKFGTVGKALENGRYLKAATLAFADAAAGYAGQKIAGVDVSFSWKDIAASMVSSVVAAKVAPKMSSALKIDSRFGKSMTQGLVGGMVSAQIRHELKGDDLNYGAIVADAFGNALGNEMGMRFAARFAPDITEPETSAGGMQERGAQATATGDIRPGIEIDVGHTRQVGASGGADQEPDFDGIQILPRVVVTPNEAYNRWYESLTAWATYYHMPLPAVGQGMEGLHKYQNYFTSKLTPEYNAYIAKSWEGHTVTNGVARSVPTDADFRAWMAGETQRVFGRFALTSIALGGLPAAATLSPIAGAAIGGYSVGSGAADIRDGHWVRGSIEILGGVAGAGVAVSQLRGVTTLADAAWMPLGSRSRVPTRALGGPTIENSAGVHPLLGLTPDDVLQAVQVLGVKTERDSLLLWSGLGPGDTGIVRSQGFAAEFGGTTLEMTPGGKWLHSMDLFGSDSPFTRLEAKQIWGRTSEMAAQQASGQVRVTMGWLQPDSVFERIELPALRANPDVTGIDFLYLKSKYGIAGGK